MSNTMQEMTLTQTYSTEDNGNKKSYKKIWFTVIALLFAPLITF